VALAEKEGYLAAAEAEAADARADADRLVQVGWRCGGGGVVVVVAAVVVH
jgi:hypothetical protein